MTRWPGVVVACALVGCGVDGDGPAEQVPANELPSELRRPPTTAAEAVATVYLVDRGRLAPHRRAAAGVDGVSALRSLLAMPARQPEGRSAVPAGTRLRAVAVAADTIVVDLTEHFAAVRGTDQMLAVAQVVFTVTEPTGQRVVDLRVEGRSLPVPVAAGTTVTRPVGRADYAALAPDA